MIKQTCTYKLLAICFQNIKTPQNGRRHELFLGPEKQYVSWLVVCGHIWSYNLVDEQSCEAVLQNGPETHLCLARLPRFKWWVVLTP